MKIAPGLLLLAAVLLWQLIELAAAPVFTITEKDNGREFRMRPGQRLTLNLRHPGGGGYSFLTPKYDETVLKMLGEHRVPPSSEPLRMGDFGRMVYEFEAIKAGETALTVSIKRPWEKNSETFLKIQILVQLQ